MTRNEITTCPMCQECDLNTQMVCRQTTAHQSWQVSEALKSLVKIIIEELRIDRLGAWLNRRIK